MSSIASIVSVEGVVREDPMEKHDRVVLIRDDSDPTVVKVNGVPQTSIYPRFILDRFVGRRVKITIKILGDGGPEGAYGTPLSRPEEESVSAIDSYRSELVRAGENPSLLRLCAFGAIAHAAMVERERDEFLDELRAREDGEGEPGYSAARGAR